jgi:hypothetical protein
MRVSLQGFLNMEQYYYLISSLPSLRWGESSGITLAQFMELCRHHLNSKDLARLEALTLRPDGKIVFPKHSTALTWREWDAELRHSMAEKRSQDKAAHRSQCQPSQENKLNVAEIYNHKNPAAREQALDGIRWKRIEELEFGHYFDLNRLYLYKFKLLLQEKWRQRNVEAGYQNFDRIISAVTPSEPPTAT